MDNSEFNNIEDLLADPSFLQYCTGTDPAAVARWRKYLEDHPDQHAMVEKARELYFFLNGGITRSQYENDRDRFLSRFKEHKGTPQLFTMPAKPLPAARRSLRKVYIAAGLAVAVAAALWTYRAAPTATETVFQTKTGEKKKWQLPDGSSILLNGGSTLTVAAGFNENNRNVYLSGEGYFEVAPNPRQPFMVHTPAILVRVLGTVFNIRAYPGDTITSASLLQGAIKVYANEGPVTEALPENGLLLSPNQKLQVVKRPEKETPGSGKAAAAGNYRVTRLGNDSTLNTLVETDWTRGRLSFNDQPFDAIALELERWYGVKIRFQDPQLKQYRFVATFDRENIDQVLRALQATSNFSYRKEQDSVIILY